MTVDPDPNARRRRPFARTFLTTVVPVAAILLVVAVAMATTRPSDVAGATGVIADDRRVAAPVVEAELLGGGQRSLADLRGHVVVLNFWASWCGPCRTEQPELNLAHAELADDDVAFLGVAVQDSEANAAAHWREFDVPYETLLDPASAFASKFQGVSPQAIPTTILIDREGRVAARIFGATEADQVIGLARDLLAEAA